jgi:hypothetical protein
VLTLGINQVPPEHYTLNETTKRQQHIDFHKTKCIAGYIGNGDMLSARRIKNGFPKHEMNQNYLNLLNTIKKTLGLCE